MVRLLIVDDEPLHRQGLLKLMGKLRPEYTLFEAVNGEEAVRIVNEEPIDVILTDIRMPIMDGFQFLEAIDPVSKNMKVIFITAYRDFEYAKKAIAFRPFEYILKPIDVEILQQCIERVERQIQQERTQSSLQVKMSRLLSESQRVYVEHQLNKDYASGLTQEEWEYLDECFPFSQPGVVACAALADPGRLPELSERDDLYAALYEVWPDKGQLLPFTLGQDRPHACAVLIRAPETHAAGETPSGIIEHLTQWLKVLEAKYECKLSVGVSAVCRSLREHWTSAYRQARENCERAFFTGYGQVHAGLQEMCSAPAVRCEDTSELADALREGDEQAVRQFMESFGRRMCCEHYTPSSVKQAYDTLMECQLRETLAPYGGDTLGAELERWREISREARTWSRLHDAAEQFLLELLRRTADKHDAIMRQIMQDCLEYVKQHYHEDLNLQEIADKYHFHPSYFSQQFHRVTGRKLSDYIMEVRLEQSKKLLAQTQEKIYKIAETVGYGHDKYFIRLFKKRFGMTPNQYRSMHYKMRGGASAGSQTTEQGRSR